MQPKLNTKIISSLLLLFCVVQLFSPHSTALAYTGVVIGTGFTVNGIKIITTQSNIFGTPVSDTEWGKALIMLPVDSAGTVLSISALKAIMVAKYGATASEKMVTVLVRGGAEEASLVKSEVLPVVRVSQVIKISTSELKPTQYLTKSATEMQKLVDDIRINGVLESVKYVVDNGVKYIVDGHHRYFASLKLGLKEIPVQEVKLPYLGYKQSSDLVIEGSMPGYWQYIK